VHTTVWKRRRSDGTVFPQAANTGGRKILKGPVINDRTKKQARIGPGGSTLSIPSNHELSAEGIIVTT